MKKFAKILAVLIAIPVLLFIVAAVVLVTIDLNNYKNEITQIVNEQTGRELTVTGELGKSFFPWLGVTAGDVALSNAKGFTDPSFVAVKRVEVKIDTLSLLRMQPSIDRVILHGLSLNLAKDKQGNTNWDDLTVAKEPAVTPPPGKALEQKATPATVPADMLAAITIGGIDIKDASVSWDDAQAGARYDVKNLTLAVSEIAYQKPLQINLSLDFVSKAPALTSHIELESQRLEWDLRQQRYQLKPLVLDVKAQGDAIGPQPVDVTLRSNITADLAQQQAAINDLQINTMGIRVSGDAEVQQFMEAPAYATKLAIAAFNPRDVLERLKVELPAMADTKALTQLALALKATGDLNQLNVSSLQVKLDDTTIEGKATVNNFSQPAITFAVEIDKVNVDHYLPPKPAKEKTSAAPAAEKLDAPEQPLPIPVELLRNLNLDGQLTIQQLTVMQLPSSDIKLGIKARQGLVDVKPASLNVASGAIENSLSLDVRKESPRYSIQQTIKSVKAAPIVKAIMDDELVSGTLNLTADVSTQGLLVSDIKKQLNGKVKFHFADGSVKGFNLGETLRKVQAKLKGKDYESGDVPLTTDFAELSGSAVINKGVVTNKDLSAKSPLLRVTGDGKVDLTRNWMNYLATAYVVGTAKGQGGKELTELKGLPVPIRLKGTFDQLDYGIDYGPIREAYKARYKKQVTEQVEKKKAEVQQKLEEEKKKAQQKLEQQKKDKAEELREKAQEKLKKLFKF